MRHVRDSPSLQPSTYKPARVLNQDSILSKGEVPDPVIKTSRVWVWQDATWIQAYNISHSKVVIRDWIGDRETGSIQGYPQWFLMTRLVFEKNFLLQITNRENSGSDDTKGGCIIKSYELSDFRSAFIFWPRILAPTCRTVTRKVLRRASSYIPDMNRSTIYPELLTAFILFECIF